MKEEAKIPTQPTNGAGAAPETGDPTQDRLKDLSAETSHMLRSEDEQQDDTVQGKISWRGIVGGEFLLSPAFRRQVPLLILILLFTIVYIDNRFTVQQQIIEIDKKEKVLTEMKYIALTRSSELTEATRQSRIEEAINAYQSELVTATNPPYLVRENPEAAPASEKTQDFSEKVPPVSEKAQALPEQTPDTTKQEATELPQNDEP